MCTNFEAPLSPPMRLKSPTGGSIRHSLIQEKRRARCRGSPFGVNVHSNIDYKVTVKDEVIHNIQIHYMMLYVCTYIYIYVCIYTHVCRFRT